MNPTRVSDTIVQEIAIKGSAEPIFEALTNPGQRLKWWGSEGRIQITQTESDLGLGGKWMMRGNGPGTYQAHPDMGARRTVILGG
jgi:uncharacterized protein YndB with AHSA1/START domain